MIDAFGARDPDRIAAVVAGLERRWSMNPGARFGQMIVELLRVNTGVRSEAEGRALYDVEDEEMLRWLGRASEAEHPSVADDLREAPNGATAAQRGASQSSAFVEWKRAFAESEDYKLPW